VVGLLSVVAATMWARPALAQNIFVSYYTPQFYLDYLVFFEPDGNPIYYENDTAYSVPAGDADHDALVTHFQQHAEAYGRWYQEVGYANLQYRLPLAQAGYQPVFYLGYLIFYDDRGRPTYYDNGGVFPVPSSYAGYGNLARHYSQHRAAYLTWYQARGRHFRWYRQPARTSTYQPLYHDGYVVYYDTSGTPYCYQNGRPVYIPTNNSLYSSYVSHYRANHASYTRWFAGGGNSYRTYRQPSSRQRVVAAGAPRAVRGKAVVRTFTAEGRMAARPEHIPAGRPRQAAPPWRGQPEPRQLASERRPAERRPVARPPAPLRPEQRQVARPPMVRPEQQRPVARPAQRPVVRPPMVRPGQQPVARPERQPVQRPVVPPVVRPGQRPVARPGQQPVQRPGVRPPMARPEQRPVAPPARLENATRRPQQRPVDCSREPANPACRTGRR